MHSANAVTTLKVLMHSAKQPEIALYGATFSSVCVRRMSKKSKDLDRGDGGGGGE